MKHFGIYANTSDVQDALNAGTLENPYVATVQGNLDYNTIEQQTCAERGLCGDDPTDCHECTCEEQYTDPAAICDCEGGYYWGDECHDEPEPGPCEDPNRQEECDCVQQGGSWEGSECVMPSDPEEPCAGMEQDIADCEGRGGTWDWPNCMCNEAPDPCEGYGSPEECECAQQGGTWEGSECHMPSD